MPPVALVTGGSRGIGLAITHRLLADGYTVHVLGTRESPPALEAELAKNENLGYTSGDVADTAVHRRFVDATLARWGRIDLLVNNAGVAPSVRMDLLEMTPESYDRVLGINLRGPLFLTQLVARSMIQLRSEPPGAHPTGVVINIGSTSATVVSVSRGEYCISKSGMAMMTQLYAVRLAAEGIPVYEVRPGIIATDMTGGVKEKYDRFIHDEGGVPTPRWGRPEDVADAVSMLAGSSLTYSTGSTVFVDGGLNIPVL
jgi:NAD(P)-dependent dehydrogenase (short-subunit alcohol dehydrogenase family)